MRVDLDAQPGISASPTRPEAAASGSPTSLRRISVSLSREQLQERLREFEETVHQCNRRPLGIDDEPEPEPEPEPELVGQQQQLASASAELQARAQLLGAGRQAIETSMGLLVCPACRPVSIAVVFCVYRRPCCAGRLATLDPSVCCELTFVYFSHQAEFFADECLAWRATQRERMGGLALSDGLQLELTPTPTADKEPQHGLGGDFDPSNPQESNNPASFFLAAALSASSMVAEPLKSQVEAEIAASEPEHVTAAGVRPIEETQTGWQTWTTEPRLSPREQLVRRLQLAHDANAAALQPFHSVVPRGLVPPVLPVV